MTQSLPTPNPEAVASPTQQQVTQSHTMTDSETRYQRLMELVEAEDASNGEVGCGRDWGERLPVYLRTCGINISDQTLRNLLREHLGHVLMKVKTLTFISPRCGLLNLDAIGLLRWIAC
jgi:hypothetical protein